MSESDLTSIIEDAVTDAGITDDGTIEAPVADVEAAPAETSDTDTTTEVSTESAEVEGGESAEVASPAAKPAPTVEEDKFAKEFGLQPQMVGGRENRIPYSRVKAIVSKAQEKALAPVTKELETIKAEHAEYKNRLAEVGQFEEVMMNDAPRFLQMLSTIPAYRQIFESLQAGAQNTQTQEVSDPNGDMPQPDQRLKDGSMVYSMEGLAKLNAWNRAQAKAEVLREVESRYAPIEQAWQTQERLNRIIPQVQAQIDEARKKPLFTENEPEIVEALKQDPNLSLEGAYNKVVFPKLLTDRDRMRQEILAEIKSKPVGSTSTTVTASRPGAQPTGPRSTESIIEEQMRLHGLS